MTKPSPFFTIVLAHWSNPYFGSPSANAEVVKETIQAPYKFNDEETRQMERQLRGELSQIDLLETQKKAANKDFSLRIENRKNVVDQLRHKLDTGEETRALEVLVEFDSKRGKKTFVHPTTGERIREEDMTPADYQLPMFREAASGNLEPAVTHTPAQAPAPAASTPAPPADPLPGGPEEPPPTPPAPAAGADGKVVVPVGGDIEKGQGKTAVGDVLDAATLKTQVGQIILDLEKTDWSISGLTSAFRAAAKKAAWSPAQIKFLAGVLKPIETVDKMIETLRPFVLGGEKKKAEPIAQPGEELEVNCVPVPRVPLYIFPGFASDRSRLEFRKAARAAGWKDREIEAVDYRAESRAREIHDEPEASEQAREILMEYCYDPEKQNPDGTPKNDAPKVVENPQPPAGGAADDDLPM